MSKKHKILQKFVPPKNWFKITTIDTHTEGEPLRIVVDGLPEIKGQTILEMRSYMKENYDSIRKSLIWEPRGHADMYGAIITDPITSGADFGTFFLHNEGYSTMCGHAIIALTKIAVVAELVEINEPVTIVKIDTPAGLVIAYAEINEKEVEKIYFHNVPSFVYKLNGNVMVGGLGNVQYDIAFGGAFYAFVNADELGIDMTTKNFRGVIDTGMKIKRAVIENVKIEHPFEEDLSFLYGTIFYGKAHNEAADSRNVCIFAEGEVDRSPTGTGVSARMALHYAKGELKIDQQMTIESILGTTFTGKVVEETTFGSYKAVIPEVSGTAHITGKHEFLIDPEDPLRNGFILR